MKLIANRQLTGTEYGTVIQGQEFECSAAIARSLIDRSLAVLATEPVIAYDSKPSIDREIKPMSSFETPEVGARRPFRYVPLCDEESKTLADSSDPVLLSSDLSENVAGTSDHRRRRQRKGFDSKGQQNTPD